VVGAAPILVGLGMTSGAAVAAEIIRAGAIFIRAGNSEGITGCLWADNGCANKRDQQSPGDNQRKAIDKVGAARLIHFIFLSLCRQTSPSLAI